MKALQVVIKSLFPDYRKGLMMEVNNIIGEHYETLRTGAIRLKNRDVVVPSLKEEDFVVNEFDIELLGEHLPEDYDPEYDGYIASVNNRRIRCRISKFGMGKTLSWDKGSERWPNVKELKTVVAFINSLFEAAAEPLKEEITEIRVVRRKAGTPKK